MREHYNKAIGGRGWGRYSPWFYAIALLWVNAYLVRHVFRLSFTGATHSMHGYWMALGRVMGDSWWRPQWVPYWAGGMPSELTYSPLVPWMSWHVGLYAVLALAFTVGPAALFWMAWQLTGRPGWAFVAGAGYALFSPTELVQPDAGFAWARALEPRRMYVTVIWDEAPHQLALAFVCMAVGAWARGWRGVAVGAIVLAALANPYGVTGAILLGACWAAASGNWRPVAVTGLLSYLIVCPFYPPSLLGILRANGAMAPESDWTAGSWAALGVTAAGFAGIAAITRGWRTPSRFFALSAWVMTVQPVLYYRWDLHFLQQPGRYKSEMEAALVLAAVFAAARVAAGWPRWAMAILAAGGLAFASQQVVRHRRFARQAIHAVDPTQSIEYRAAFAARGTVFAAGSLAHWMNAFADVRQYTGGSYATTPNPEQQRLALAILGEPDWRRVLDQLQTVGVDAIFVSGRNSPEFWKPFAADVLAGHLPILWEERDTRLYAIPARPHVSVAWETAEHGRAAGGWSAGEWVTIPMNWSSGWRAYRNGAAVPVRANVMGQLEAQLGGAGELELVYEPVWWTRAVSVCGLALLLWVQLKRRGGP